MDEACEFLKEHNRLYSLWGADIWNELQQSPDEDLITAYEDICYEHDCCKS
jgi:hypothetical protein